MQYKTSNITVYALISPLKLEHLFIIKILGKNISLTQHHESCQLMSGIHCYIPVMLLML